MKKLFCLVFCVLAMVFSVQAQNSAPIEPLDLISLLGYTPELVLARLGAPSRVRAVRGAEVWQDDVVFEYPLLAISLFFWEDRVWQVRLDQGFSGRLMGVDLVLDADRIVAGFGAARSAGDFWQEWAIAGNSWPVRLRLVFHVDEKPGVAYVYRADF